MNRQVMTRIVGEELEHISKDRTNFDQQLLRSAYNAGRRHGLTRGHTAWEDLQIAVRQVRAGAPDAVLLYDKDWFSSR